jgi:hypothetical protein
MDEILEGAYFLKCYIDDVLMHNKGLLQHLAHLKELFKRLHEVNMKIHPKKCEFAITSIVYLKHKILPNGIMVHWAKVLAILEMPNPTNIHTLRSFIGLCNNGFDALFAANRIVTFVKEKTIRFMSKTLVLLLILFMHY